MTPIEDLKREESFSTVRYLPLPGVRDDPSGLLVRHCEACGSAESRT
jgi:hypothetical protein